MQFLKVIKNKGRHVKKQAENLCSDLAPAYVIPETFMDKIQDCCVNIADKDET